MKISPRIEIAKAIGGMEVARKGRDRGGTLCQANHALRASHQLLGLHNDWVICEAHPSRRLRGGTHPLPGVVSLASKPL